MRRKGMAASVGWVLLDQRGHVVQATPGVAEMLGVSPEAIAPGSPPAVNDWPADLGLPAAGTEPLSFTLKTAAAPVQAQVFSLAVAAAHLNLVILCAAAGSTDLLAELQRAREAIRELEAVFDASFDGIWLIDHTGKVLRINRAYERFTGIRAQDLIGRQVDELVQAGYLADSVTSRVIETKQIITILNRVRGGKSTLSTGTPVLDEHGQVWRVVINARDISELVNIKAQLQEEHSLNQRYRQELEGIRRLQQGALIWRSEAMRRVGELSARVAAVDSTVLITGESGTGKELVASLIHELSPRRSGPLIRINCGAIPEQLLESELFGYERGAFTGALRDGKPGLFQLADRGTLFLDEVTELPLALQTKLLRALQTREITRVGGTRPIALDIRIVAATNRSPREAVALGHLREDLYYRLNVVPIHIPPLRERPDDILLLLDHFLRRFNDKYGYTKYFSQEARRRLVEYEWPGNVRELENLVERLVVTSVKDEITLEHLLPALQRPDRTHASGRSLREQVAAFERTVISETVHQAGSIRKAAQILRVDFSSLARKARRLGVALRGPVSRGPQTGTVSARRR